MNDEKEKMTGLPENAFRSLHEGEEYKPLMSPDRVYTLRPRALICMHSRANRSLFLSRHS